MVCSHVQFLERHEGESVVLPCMIEHRNTSPFGVYLKRSWLHPSEVLFMYTKSEFSVTNVEDKIRTSVTGDPSSHSLNVTISQLRISDTDRYYCEFVVNNPSSEDERIPGKTEFFVLVTEIKSVFNLLAPFTDLFSSCLNDCQSKARHRVSSRPQPPVYEEMTGLQSVGRKLSPCHLEEMESSEYRNCFVKKSSENYYESPSGALCPRSASQK
uniref:Ig-like domain-containing protein n=1 Tax=Monopterus albus TaxID=43700 RepID=A0A3Q3RAH9_MONAL